MTPEEKLDTIINEILYPLIGDLWAAHVLPEWKRDEIWSRLRKISNEQEEGTDSD